MSDFTCQSEIRCFHPNAAARAIALNSGCIFYDREQYAFFSNVFHMF